MKQILKFIICMIIIVAIILIANFEHKKHANDNVESQKEVEEHVLVNSSPSPSIDYVNCDVPSNNTIKSYMGYKTITLKSSRQYKLQQIATTDKNGLRKVDDRYCVALGSYYTTTIGQYVDVELKNGEVIKGILADCKSDNHTDSTNKIHSDGSVVEFVVDTKYLDKTCKIMGDVSYINNWNSKVVNIKVYDKVKDF